MTNNTTRHVEYVRINGRPCVRLELTQGHAALFDAADFERIREQYGLKWTASKSSAHGGHVYARKAARTASGRIQLLSLHRAVLNAQPGDRVLIDSGDRLDVRRQNLTLVPAERCNEQRQMNAERRHRERQQAS